MISVLPFLRSPMGKGVMPDDHPLSVAAARTLALQNADVVFLMGARFNWIFHFGQPPRYARDVKVIQLDISPEEIGHNKATEVALVGDGKAIVGQLNRALTSRQWFYPKDTPWRQMITKKADENAAQIRPQIHDDEAPANYFRALRDVAAWMPKNAILSAEGAGTMDIGLTQLPSFSARSCLNAGTYGTMGVGLGHAIAACIVHPDRPVIHLSGDSAIGFSGMEMETLVRYNFPAKIVVLNNGGPAQMLRAEIVPTFFDFLLLLFPIADRGALSTKASLSRRQDRFSAGVIWRAYVLGSLAGSAKSRSRFTGRCCLRDVTLQ
jgi:2-hydroxyacyl-CoA lyase 1